MSRAHRVVLAVAGVIALAVVGALGGTWLVGQVVTAVSDAWPGGPESSPPAPEGPTVPPSEVLPEDHPTAPPSEVPTDAEAAIVDRVVDGDTVRVIAAPGGSIAEGGSIGVRLLNIDAPEKRRDGQPAECGAQAATERLDELIAPSDLVWLVADREDRDVYDRPLRGMWTSDGVFLNELLAEEGLADALLIAPNDRFHDRIVAAVDRAQREGRGIWGELCAS